jgi:DNA-binding NarL/FixJ family response regulator
MHIVGNTERSARKPMSETKKPPTSEKSKVSIVIADDHAVLRESLSALLNTQPDFRVIGSAGSGMEALDLMQKHHPQVLVLDLLMPNGDGFEVLRTLDRAGSRVASVVLTASDKQTDYVQTVRYGARGLVLKTDGPEKLFSAIRNVAAGELAFSDEITQQVIGAIAADTSVEVNTLARLSEREQEIANLVARGLKNRDIAAQLAISENTVKRHLQSIFSKTGSRDRLELAVLALTEISRAA